MFPTITLATVVTDAGTISAEFASLVGVVLAVILAFAAIRLGLRMLRKSAR